MGTAIPAAVHRTTTYWRSPAPAVIVVVRAASQDQVVSSRDQCATEEPVPVSVRYDPRARSHCYRSLVGARDHGLEMTVLVTCETSGACSSGRTAWLEMHQRELPVVPPEVVTTHSAIDFAFNDEEFTCNLQSRSVMADRAPIFVGVL